jgi:hypothetical protein
MQESILKTRVTFGNKLSVEIPYKKGIVSCEDEVKKIDAMNKLLNEKKKEEKAE